MPKVKTYRELEMVNGEKILVISANAMGRRGLVVCSIDLRLMSDVLPT